MSDAMPAAWSNGQWIWMDLAGNRYLGGDVHPDPAMHAAQAAAVAPLHEAVGDEEPLFPSLGEAAHYLRCASVARRVRDLPIREQLAVMRSTGRLRSVGGRNVARYAWLYQHMRNLRPRRPMCLEDSVCCALFMVRYVGNPSFCIGVVRPPFMAHAWVRVGNVLVNDTKGSVESYSEILRYDL